ncbi:MAG TPA: hypothetical protein DIV38_03435 [Clostridiales bacterium]|nr:hypothetical protein [Clostridiales bacterium]
MKTHTNADNVKYKTAVNAQGVLTEKGTRTTTQVELGQYISLGKYNGKDIVWRCVSVDDKGSLMLADKVIDTLPYDAKTNDNNRSKSHSRNYNRDNRGSNYWKDSNMRSWLNSTAVAGEVKWLCGNPPREDSVDGNAYDQKAGFLNDFSKAEIAAMKNVTQRSIVSHPEYNLGFHDGEGRSDLEFNRDIENVANNFDSAYGENSTEKVFLPDVKQVNTVWKNFSNYYIARNEQGVAWPYWLRTPYSSCNHLMRYVEASGSIERHYPMTDYMGVRPAFYLDSDYYVTTSGDGSASNPYVGSAPDKIEDDYTVAEPEEDPNQEWDISLDQSLNLTLGPWYSSDGKYANPTIPVYTIQKTRSDTENMVILFCGEGYTKSQQQKFINDVKKVWESAMQHEPYRSYADRFNVYALCTASESSFNSGGSTFFDVVIDKKSGPMIGVSKSISKNHIFERCIGPAFLEKIHDAHIPKKTDPNSSYWVGNNSPLSEYEPFYYVHKYINQFAVLVNTTQDFGGSHRNYERGIHYLITPADSARAQKTFTHELGHGLLELGDEYMSSTTQQTDLTSLNVAHTHDPNNVKWKQLLGFRKTYTCNALGYGNAYNSSYECLMRDTTYGFCEVCKLQGSKRMSQLIDGKSLYVADPEVKKYTGQYSQPSDFEDTTYNGYANFAYYRSGVLLSGTDKNKFNTSMAGEKIQLRTIVQNLSDTTQRYVTMKMWIKRAYGSVATTRSGDKLETSQTFTIPVWSEKSKFWPKGALSYEGSNMNSGLENCELIYQIPADAVLNPGDTVAFEVTDEKGNVLANDNTETQTYANINIEYKFEDGTPMPNANKAKIPVAVGSKLNWTAPAQLYGHTFVRAEGHDQMVNGSGQTVTYYYTKQSNVHTHDWGEWVTNGNGTHSRICKTDNSHKETENCVGGKATCTHKPVCDVCHGEYGQAKSHDWGEWVSGGNGTHTRTCRTDNAHKETENCVGGTATCTHKPVCDVCHGEYGQAKSHDWGKATYTWTDTVCKAERVCKHDSAHIESETVTATGTVIKAATCKEKGKMKYTATFENTAFTKQEKEVDIDFAEHDFDTLIPEVPATTTEFGVKEHKDCKVCGKHFDKDGGEITELRIAKIGTHNVIVNGESKFYAHGESVTVTAEDKEGKVFKGWKDESGKIVSTDKSYKFTVSEEKNLTAVYEDKPSGGGEITPPAKKDGLSGGAIAGIVIGSVAVAGIGGFAVLWFAVKKKTFTD